MIKEKGSHFGPWTKAYCDSCHIKMFECAQIHWEEGQELFYTPLLCEKCGIERSKDHGDKTQLLADIDKIIKKKEDNTIDKVEKILDDKKELFR